MAPMYRRGPFAGRQSPGLSGMGPQCPCGGSLDFIDGEFTCQSLCGRTNAGATPQGNTTSAKKKRKKRSKM